LELIFPTQSSEGWHLSLPVGVWTGQVRKSMRLEPTDLVEVEFSPTFRVSAKLLLSKTKPLADLLPQNQLVLYLTGLALFGLETTTPEEYAMSRELLRRAATAEVGFPGVKEQSLDLVPLVSYLLDPTSIDDPSKLMDLQRDFIDGVANGGVQSTTTPMGPDFYWILLIRTGLYLPAENLARMALERSAPEERALGELRLQRTAWLRSQIAVIGRRAIKITAEELAVELAKPNEEKK